MELRILFIGGTGSISTDCVKELLSSGHEIWVLNRGSKIDRLPKDVHFVKDDYWTEKLGQKIWLLSQVWDCVINCIV
jgi:nucleoside-diphosphate-sugar epimerase